MKSLDQLTESITRKVVEKSITPITIKDGKCNAHLYHLERQGDSKKSRFIYRCHRPGCRHYSTIAGIENRSAQCRTCGRVFSIIIEVHVLRDRDGKDAPSMLHEYPVCCEGIQEAREVEVTEEAELDFLEE